MVENSLLVPVIGLGSAFALVIALILHRARKETHRGDMQRILVGNYERWVRGLRELIDSREKQINALRASVEGATDEMTSNAVEALGQSQERLRALLMRQLRGDHRTEIDVQGLQREVLAQLDLISALLAEPPESIGQEKHTREAIDQIRRKMAEVEQEAFEVEGALETERVEMERRLAELVPARALEEALSLLDALENDLQALERTVLDREGQLRTSFSDKEIGRFEKRLRVIGEEIASTTADLHDASEHRDVHSIGHRLRLKRIERGMLRRFIDAHHLTHERDHLEREVNRLAVWKQDANQMIDDFQRIEALNTELRLELARARERLQQSRRPVLDSEIQTEQAPAPTGHTRHADAAP